MVKVKEPPEELQRQKEDIENLLSSLEAGFAEGSITQEHYNEVRQKNLEKLEEITRKLKIAEKKVQKQAPEAEPEPKEPAPKEADMKEGRRQETPSGKESAPAKEKEEAKEKKPGILGEISSKISGEKGIDEERLKEKIIMELSPKMEKINVRLVKLKAFLDAMKEDKTGERETAQRVNEELGETRSAMGSIEGRLGEMEMKLEDVSETLTDLKPQRFAKELQKKEEELKMHEARLEKLDDMNTNILKRMNQIQIILEKLGNIESIADMTKGISTKLVSIDEKEKKITRLADKIDNMFVEINKRLEEFMFYKAKQDSLDDLSKEMLKSMDELTTKLTRYAEKDDLELLRDTLDNKISTLMKEGAASSAPVQLSQDHSDVESLMKMLEEQFKKGQISKKDYEKAKAANIQKVGVAEPAPKKAALPEAQETVIDQTPPVEEEPLMEETPPEEPETQEPREEPAPEQEEAEPEEPEQIEPKPAGKKPASAKPAKKAIPKPKHEEPLEEEPTEEDIKPKATEKAAQREKVSVDAFQPPTPTKDEIAKKIASAKPPDKKQKMLADLDYSLRKGLISQKAYENAQKVVASIKF